MAFPVPMVLRSAETSRVVVADYMVRHIRKAEGMLDFREEDVTWFGKVGLTPRCYSVGRRWIPPTKLYEISIAYCALLELKEVSLEP